MLRKENAELQKEADDLVRLAGKLFILPQLQKKEKYSSNVKKVTTKRAEDTKTIIENVYKERKKALDDAIEQEELKTKIGLDKVNKEYEIKLRERKALIEKDLKEGKLNEKEAKDLRKRAGLLTTTELNKAIEDYKKERLEKQKSLENGIIELQQEAINKRIDNLPENLKNEIEKGRSCLSANKV